MFWSRLSLPFSSLRARLTFWHAFLLSLFLVVLLVSVDSFLRSHLLGRMDDALSTDVREYDALYVEYGLAAVEDEFRRESEIEGAERVVLVFLSPGLRRLASSDLSAWEEFPLRDASLADLPPGEIRFRTLSAPGIRRRLRVAEGRTADGNFVQVGRSRLQEDRFLGAYRRVSVAGLCLVLLVAVTLGWALTSRAMSGVAAVTRTAQRIGESDLSARVPAANRGREIEDLAQAFNAMLDRIDSLVQEMKQVNDNIAHDIRSPLTRIRGVMEGLAVDVGMPAQVRESAGEVVEQCDRLSAMLTTMLEIAEINAGVLPLAPCPVDFCELVREASDLWGPVAEDRGLDLSADVPDRPVVVAGNLSMLQRVVANLVDNAIKYSEPGGRIALTLTVEDSEAVCRVSDTGTGIADEDRLRIFDRFYRCDASRASPGHGLGLPLALAIVRAHGGSLSVRSGFGEGSCFTVTVPLASV